MTDRRKKITKWSALCLAVVVAAGGVQAAAYAKTPEKQEETEESVKEQVKDAVEKIWKPVDADGKLYKEETVYVLTDAEGAVNKVIVSDRLQNGTGAELITDETQLLNVTAVKAGENFTVDEKGAYVWNTDGEDVYYQGTTEKELPVSVKAVYMLDGKEIAPDELAGKSGHVVIRYEFLNHSREYVQVNGKEEKLCVPYAVLSAMVLDNTKFRNVTVSQGKIINDGTRSIVAGITFPGMAESLGMEEESFPTAFEVEADANDFSMGSTYTLVTNEFFSEFDLDDADGVNGLKDTLKKVTDGINELLAGSSALYDGMCELSDKTGELKKGVTELAAGSAQLKDGAEALSGGIHTLQGGATELASGLNTLNAKSSELTEGAKQVFNVLLDTANAQLAAKGIPVQLTIDNYADAINGILASGQQEIYRQVCAGVKAEVVKAVLAAQGLTAESYAALPAEDPVRQAIDGAVETQMQTETVQKQIGDLVAAQAGNPDIKQLLDLKAQLDSYNSFYQGVLAYTAGVSTAAGGANKLNGGVNQLAAGADSLCTGVNTLRNGMQTLTDGTTALTEGVFRLKDGSKALSDGAQAFSGVAEADWEELSERLKAVLQVSKAYDTFAGKSKEMEGTVKFIIRTAEIK